MDPHYIASLVDGGIPFVGGLYFTCLAYRWVGPKPGDNPQYDSKYRMYFRWGKWGGPLVMLSGIFIFLRHMLGW